MKRRKFIKGSAVVGASLAAPKFIMGASGMISDDKARRIYHILDVSNTMVGTLPILRAFAGDYEDHVSPYVLFDEFGPVQVDAGSKPLRVDAHPHAGVIPTTYFLEGNGHHKDSLDYDFQIKKGDFMMFSSGRGAIHMEESGNQLKEEGGIYHGFQIWLNMPAKYKHIAPTTGVYNDKKLGSIDNDQFQATVLLGELFEAKADIELLSPAFYYHIKLKKNGKISIPTKASHNAFAYNIRGNVELVDQQKLKANQVALFERGAEFVNLYSKEGAELLVLGGQPLNETVYSYGPFVMNNEAQIRQCIMDYQNGKMGNPDLVN